MTIKISLKSLKLKTVIITVKWNVLVYKAHSSVFFFLFVMELADLKWLLFAKGRIEISITSSR
ncbi:hypothetical protein T06_14055 [Trichinella sp. T6]|nr:hypothetical protein T06_14055 [Trichinella sp. T6]